MQVTYSPLLQAAQIVYWLSLSTWFGCVLFVGVAAPIIFRVVQQSDPLLPTVLSVNLEGQHATLLAGSIVSELISMLIRIGWVCAAVLLPALIVQAFMLSASHGWVTILRCVLYCLSVLVLLYQWRVLVPGTTAARKQYIEHADEPEIANPAKDQFDRYHQESVTALMTLLFLLLGMVLFSASSLLPFSAPPMGH
ncbi:MAG TPA: DUF4149 domain-containing protein [Tepidisphaeraceae bacterium]|jgi:hypothetical protein|nr:DUF4149 domain-containing protein [Tepidisphaeraceae bacterium]